MPAFPSWSTHTLRHSTTDSPSKGLSPSVHRTDGGWREVRTGATKGSDPLHNTSTEAPKPDAAPGARLFGQVEKANADPSLCSLQAGPTASAFFGLRCWTLSRQRLTGAEINVVPVGLVGEAQDVSGVFGPVRHQRWCQQL